MPQQVFISYSHNDISVVQHLKRALQQQRTDVWIDFQNIRAGEDWGDAIQRGLDESDQMVLIVTPASMHSRRVRAEWRYFLFRRKRVIPVLLEGPDEIMGYELLDLHYINCTGQPFEHALPQVMAELARPADMESQAGSVAEVCQEEEVTSAVRMIRPPYLHPKSTFVQTGRMIERVNQELWVSGISVNRVLECDNEIAHFLQARPENKIRFLLVNSENASALDDTSSFVGRRAENMLYRLRSTEHNLLPWVSEYGGQIDIRRLSHRPSVGYFISDPDGENGIMTVSPYFFQIDVRKRRDPDCEPPFLYLERRFESWWFENFKQDFLEMWKHATPLPVT